MKILAAVVGASLLAYSPSQDVFNSITQDQENSRGRHIEWMGRKEVSVDIYMTKVADYTYTALDAEGTDNDQLRIRYKDLQLIDKELDGTIDKAYEADTDRHNNTIMRTIPVTFQMKSIFTDALNTYLKQ